MSVKNDPTEYVILQLKDIRGNKGVTQSQVAKQMCTTASSVARLESGGGKKRHSPSLRTLRLYAQCIGFNVSILLVPIDKNQAKK
jgi:transcriptional regulator with XRE-family HTH domain